MNGRLPDVVKLSADVDSIDWSWKPQPQDMPAYTRKDKGWFQMHNARGNRPEQEDDE